MKYLILIVFAFSLLRPQSAQAEIDPRVKVVGQVALYGTAGGALLGLASLAFDGEGRNIAKGASLGLYAGLVFGAYIVVSHYQKNRPVTQKPGEYSDDASTPYDDEALEEEFWRRPGKLRYDFSVDQQNKGKFRLKDVPVYFNLLKFNF